MKKTISGLFLCILMLLPTLCACDNTGAPNVTGTGGGQETGSYAAYENISGDYFYRRANTLDGKALLLRYNVHTGAVDTVCNNPFCTHSDESCPFWSVSDSSDWNTVYIGNTVYFTKETSSDGKYHVCAYSPDDISLSYIYTSNNSLYSLFTCGQYLFFGETTDMEARKHAVIKMNVKTGDIEYLRESTSDSIYAISEGRIIWNTSKG